MCQLSFFVFILHTASLYFDMLALNTTHVFFSFLFLTFVIVNVITSSSSRTVMATVDEFENNRSMTASKIYSLSF